MKMEKKIHLKFVSCTTENGKVQLSREPEDIDDLRIDVFEDKYVPVNQDAPDDSNEPIEFKSTGLKQVHLSGTPSALADLGKFLIGISETTPPEDFLSHLEPIKGRNGENSVHLVVHHIFREDMEPTIRIGDLIELDEDETNFDG